MRRVLPVLLPFLLITGCDGGDAPSPAPIEQVRASFPKGGLVDAIAIDATERLPLRAAELVAPDGRATPASSIDVTASPAVATGQWNAANPWPVALAPPGSAAPLAQPGVEANAALQGRVQLLAMVSSAEITLPDPVAYRRDWARYRIRLTFGTPPGETETREIAAPAPPPGS